MIKFFLGLALFALTFYGHAQSVEVEQLRKQIQKHTQQDTARVNLLIKICYSIPNIPIEEIEKNADEALLLSHKLKYTEGEGFALALQSRLNFINRNLEDGFAQLTQADSIAKKTNNILLKFRVNSNFFTYYNLINDYREALSYALQAEELALQLGDLELIDTSQRSVANFYRVLGDYARALDYSMKSLRNAEELNSQTRLYNAWNALANTYTLIGEYEKSNDYLQKLTELHKKLEYGNPELVGLYVLSGENYRLDKKYIEAIEQYNLALKIAPEAIDSLIPLSNLADVYVSMDSLPLAFQYGYKSIEMAEKSGNNSVDAWIFGILARAHMKQNRPDSALFYADQGFKLGIQTGYMEDMRDNALALADAYALKNDFRNAYDYYKTYISYRDSMMSAEVKNKSTVLEYNFEMEKKEDEILLLNEQKKSQRNFLISALIVLGLILISVFLLLRNNRQKQKANLLLQQQKQEIDEKAKELSLQKENLEKSYNNVELLGEIGRKVTASLSVDKIIGTVYGQVNALMDASVFGIGIYHEETQTLDFPSTYENGEALPPYSNSIQDPNRLSALSFNSGNEIVINDLNEEYGKYLQKMPTPSQGNVPVSLIYLPLKAKGKTLGVITVQSFYKNTFTDYHLYMLRNIAVYAAIALENAESFKKLQITLNSLKETQNQLIQSEKMASLGELTAGIAHEIQNPLNFVNNFSELSVELADELKDELSKLQLDSNHKEELESIADDIIQNQQKINHHGKRADAIVKGMLAHSRSNAGEKIPTDINALADEYLRLSYHGLRARDKSFNADFKTDFDPTLPKVNVVPQDIGRVLLNVINNAFQACSNEDFRFKNLDLKPSVTVSTKNLGEKVQITVSDNGPGIPESIKVKIFQPFFTTKPTGQGTGLGLSLSYDIVKAHGGEMEVQSQPGQTNFNIHLKL